MTYAGSRRRQIRRAGRRVPRDEPEGGSVTTLDGARTLPRAPSSGSTRLLAIGDSDGEHDRAAARLSFADHLAATCAQQSRQIRLLRNEVLRQRKRAELWRVRALHKTNEGRRAQPSRADATATREG